MVFRRVFFCFKQKTAYEMRISDWSSDVCSSDLRKRRRVVEPQRLHHRGSGILGASRAEDRREGRSEWRAVEVWASLQPTEILLAFLDLVPVLPLILVQLLEVFRELKDGRNGVVVVVVPAGAGHGIAGTAEEIVAALVGMGLPISRRLALAALRLVVGGGVARHQRRGAAVLAAAPVAAAARQGGARGQSQDQRRSEEHTSELQSLMRISY